MGAFNGNCCQYITQPKSLCETQRVWRVMDEDWQSTVNGVENDWIV